MRIPFFFIISLILASFAAGCISDDFSDSPRDVLTFSTDTLSFDTIFTDLGSPTARLKVYNRASKSINISSIRMRSDDGIFSLNVDGVSGRQFENIEIRANDSIFVFVECIIDANSQNSPFRVTGDLDFVTNGVTQSVVLEAYGQNVERLRNVTLTADHTLTADRPYVVFDTLRVAEGATLRIMPGARIYFHDKASLQVDGTLLAIGETGKMIQMRGDRLGEVLPETGYEILAGQWGGITFGEKSFGNRMEFVEMQSSTSGVVVDSCGITDRTKLTLVNSWLHNSQRNVLKSSHAKVDAFGCCFSDAGNATVSLTGGSHRMVQCTFANYYLFAISPEAILTLRHLKQEDPGSDISNPLMKADFENCIIYGITSPLSPGDLDDADVYFRRTLLGVGGSDDEHFIECIWDEDPMFETVRNEYYFNYHLKEDSPAIGAGEASFVTDIDAYDMDGVYRLGDGNPTLGAYSK